jgi:hypothetical protein
MLDMHFFVFRKKPAQAVNVRMTVPRAVVDLHVARRVCLVVYAFEEIKETGTCIDLREDVHCLRSKARNDNALRHPGFKIFRVEVKFVHVYMNSKPV